METIYKIISRDLHYVLIEHYSLPDNPATNSYVRDLLLDIINSVVNIASVTGE